MTLLQFSNSEWNRANVKQGCFNCISLQGELWNTVRFLITPVPFLMVCQVSSLPLHFPNIFSGFFHWEILLSMPTLLRCIEIHCVFLPRADFLLRPTQHAGMRQLLFQLHQVLCTATRLWPQHHPVAGLARRTRWKRSPPVGASRVWDLNDVLIRSPQLFYFLRKLPLSALLSGCCVGWELWEPPGVQGRGRWGHWEQDVSLGTGWVGDRLGCRPMGGLA